MGVISAHERGIDFHLENTLEESTTLNPPATIHFQAVNASGLPKQPRYSLLVMLQAPYPLALVGQSGEACFATQQYKTPSAVTVPSP